MSRIIRHWGFSFKCNPDGSISRDWLAPKAIKNLDSITAQLEFLAFFDVTVAWNWHLES